MSANPLPYHIQHFEYKNRLPDRFLASQLQSHQLTDHAEPVGLAVMVEIINPWHPTAILGNQLISTLHRAFDQSESSSALIKFEDALKAANQIISQIEEQLQTSVNCLAVLLVGQEIHFSAVGETALYVLHQDKPLNAVEKQEKSKQFATVTSGDIAENDLVIIGNQTFNNILSSGEYWSAFAQGSRKIYQRTSQLPLLDPDARMTALFLRVTAEAPTTERHHWENLEPRVPLKLPRVNFLWSWFPALLKRFQQRLTKITPDATSDNQEETTDIKEVELEASLDDPIPATRRRLPKSLIAAIALITIILGASWQYVIKPMRQLQKSATTQVSFLDQVNAQPTESLPQYWLDHLTSQAYTNLSQEEKDALSQLLSAKQIAITNPQLVNQLASPIQSLSQTSSQLLIIDSTGQLWQVPANQPPIKVNQQAPISNPIAITSPTAERIVATDQAGNVWLYDNSSSQPQALGLPNQASGSSKLIESFNGNLYLLSPTAKTLWRVNKFDREISGLTTYIKPEIIALDEIVDLAINSQIFVVNKSGVVKDFNRGKTGTLNLQLTGLTAVPRIATTESNPDLFFASGKLIWRYQSTGQLVKSWLLPIDKPISDIHLDQSGETLWVAADTSLYQLPI